jgi:hypothetical protein
MKKGYVYILTNPSFQEDWIKIGQAEDLEQRIKTLSNKTCLPFAFQEYASCKTAKYKELEKHLHVLMTELGKIRVTPNREFFQIVPSQAAKYLEQQALLIDDAEFRAPGRDNEEAAMALHHATPAPPFRFSMVHLAPGAELIFEPTGTKVVVKEHKVDNKIEYEGITYTLSGFCKKFMPEDKRNSKDAYQGPSYFSYDGTLLVKLRAEYERKE